MEDNGQSSTEAPSGIREPNKKYRQNNKNLIINSIPCFDLGCESIIFVIWMNESRKKLDR